MNITRAREGEPEDEQQRGFVIRILGTARTLFPDSEVLYFEDMEPRYGELTFTPSLDDAAVFRDRAEAISQFQSIPTELPKRKDGKANRPLTAYTVAITSRSEEHKRAGEPK